MIKQIIPRDYCLNCQGCCRFSQQDSAWLPCLLNEEIENLLKKNFPPFIISQGKKIRSEPHPEEHNFICSFFQTQDNKCRIYTFRPFECQLYPFLINQEGKEIFLAIDLKCPFAQKNLESPEFKLCRQYLTDFLNNEEGTALLKSNPQIIQTYPGVLNLIKLSLRL